MAHDDRLFMKVAVWICKEWDIFGPTNAKIQKCHKSAEFIFPKFYVITCMQKEVKVTVFHSSGEI